MTRKPSATQASPVRLPSGERQPAPRLAPPRFCVVIPAYQEADRIHWVVRGCLSHCAHVVVVDDGSTDATSEQARQAGAVVLRHEQNRGKGSALRTGFHYALEQGFQAVVTLDGNGRHSPGNIPAFVDAYLRTGTPVIVGNRMGEAGSFPLTRRWTNSLATAILNRRMGGYIPDSQCGFRFYCCDVFEHVTVRSIGRSAESEILLELSARRYRIDSVPVEMTYGRDRSLLSPLRDSLEFIFMLRRQRLLHRGSGA